MIRSALALAAIILTTPVAARTTIDVSLAEARSLATQALFSGDTGAALEIARAIVSQAPDDRAAWLIIAAAAPQQGAGGEGRIAGARGYACHRAMSKGTKQRA